MRSALPGLWKLQKIGQHLLHAIEIRIPTWHKLGAPNKMNSTRCAHKMLLLHDDQAFVLVHTADRFGFSTYPLWQKYSEDLASGRRLSLSKSSITAPGPVKPPPGLLSFKQWWSLRSFLCFHGQMKQFDDTFWWRLPYKILQSNFWRRNWCLTKTFCSEAARPRWSCSGGKVPGSFQQQPQFFYPIFIKFAGPDCPHGADWPSRVLVNHTWWLQCWKNNQIHILL